MKELKINQEIDENTFLKKIYLRKNNILDGKYISNLFSRTRDSLHQREIQIIDEMLMNKLINIENYYLCDNKYYEDYKKLKKENIGLFYGGISRYGYDCTDDLERELNLKDLYMFRGYRQEHISCLISKYTAFEYFKEFYSDIKWDRNDESFYIKDLNLLIVYENQRIIDFINRCLNKDINLAVISDYEEDDKHKLAIRYIKPNYEIMDYIYPEDSLYYSKYTNNFNDVVGRYILAKNLIEHIIIRRDISNISENDIVNIKSCLICKNFKRFDPDSRMSFNHTSFGHRNLDEGLDALKFCSERDVCRLDNENFDIYSNNIECPNYSEITLPCFYCGKGSIPYTKYYFEKSLYCSDECRLKQEERDEKSRQRQKKRELKEIEINRKLKEYDDKLNKELEEKIANNDMSEEEIEKAKLDIERAVLEKEFDLWGDYAREGF